MQSSARVVVAVPAIDAAAKAAHAAVAATAARRIGSSSKGCASQRAHAAGVSQSTAQNQRQKQKTKSAAKTDNKAGAHLAEISPRGPTSTPRAIMEMEEKRMAPSTVKHWTRGEAIGGGKARK